MTSLMRQQMRRINGWLLLLLVFCLPLSTSGITVAVFLVLICWLLEGGFREKWLEIAASPMCWAVLLYFVVQVVGLCWTDDVLAGLAAIREQWKLLLLPVFLTIVYQESRWRYAAAFIAGVTAVMLLIWLARFGLLAQGIVESSTLINLFNRHIVFTPMLALAMYLVLHQALWGGIVARRRWLLLALAAALAGTIFMTRGRAGQMVFFVLLVLLAFQYYQRNTRKAGVLLVVALPLVFLAGYVLSPVFQERVDMVRHELVTFDQNPDTAVGQRLVFWHNTWAIVKQAPWFGVGTGGFDAAYAQVHQQHSFRVPSTDNPHNQYLFAAVQQGVLGVAALLGLFAVPLVQARRARDGWGRIRLAFVLFFLVIMSTDSYLNTYSTAFLFAVFSAILGKGLSGGPLSIFCSPRQEQTKRYWLILSYRTNIPGAAASQHIDDRLPLLEQAGITPIILSGPLGKRFAGRRHHKTWSFAPSGIRFELRHFLLQRLRRRWQFKLAETVLLFPVLPFYLLEKLVINLESEWSWFAGATVRGFFLQCRYQPEVIYSTGGSASAHVAALLLHNSSPAQWIAETQDPLVHDQDWPRSHQVFRLYRWLENQIASHCDAFVFMTRQALEHARQRVGGKFPGVVLYPGATMRQARHGYVKGDLCRFAHFGSLAGSRNLVVFFQALHLLLKEQPDAGQRVRVDIYGSFDPASKKAMSKLRLEPLVVYHGLVDRQAALGAMDAADCLLLIQNISFFSTETIPSKVYEYFLCGRPILGLLHRNEELAAMLTAQGHFVTRADDPAEVKNALREILTLHATTSFVTEPSAIPVYTTAQAVDQLLALATREPRPSALAKAPGSVAADGAEVCPGPCDARLADHPN